MKTKPVCPQSTSASDKTCQRQHQLHPPPASLQIAELRSASYLARLVWHWRHLPGGALCQRKVMVIPGFYGGEWSILPIKYFLRRQGHHAHSWGQGMNRGELEVLHNQVVSRLRLLHERHEEPIDLVGWSLGGIYARELARLCPDSVRQVVTLGSPVMGGPRVTALHRLAGLFDWDVEQIERDMAARHDIPITCPVHAIYSRLDGIVNWQACIDHWSPQVTHHEVSASHIGMGFSAEVLTLVNSLLDH